MNKEFFPTGKEIDSWFYDKKIPALDEQGKKYIVTDFGIADDGKIYTEKLQALIDKVSEDGGGVIVVPRGTFMTGALFFKKGVNLYIEEGGTLKGSDDINDYALLETRIEGETCMYFSALINADNADGFILSGKGTIDGNGEKAWKAFWKRLKWNKKATNKDEQRPRLIYISNSKDVTIGDLHLQNSHYWTTHIYKCNHVKLLNLNIFSPEKPIAAPSTDAIDIDFCSDILVSGCRIHVNDDGVVLKGGKGPFADTQPENGINERIIIEDCFYEFCHGCITCGSESIHNRDILFRRNKVERAFNMFWLKMRPDTPQIYEHIEICEVEGKMSNFVNVYRWTQFFDLKGREDMPVSVADNINIHDCKVECKNYFDFTPDKNLYELKNFTFKNLSVKALKNTFSEDYIENVKVEKVEVEIVE